MEKFMKKLISDACDLDVVDNDYLLEYFSLLKQITEIDNMINLIYTKYIRHKDLKQILKAILNTKKHEEKIKALYLISTINAYFKDNGVFIKHLINHNFFEDKLIDFIEQDLKIIKFNFSFKYNTKEDEQTKAIRHNYENSHNQYDFISIYDLVSDIKRTTNIEHPLVATYTKILSIIKPKILIKILCLQNDCLNLLIFQHDINKELLLQHYKSSKNLIFNFFMLIENINKDNYDKYKPIAKNIIYNLLDSQDTKDNFIKFIAKYIDKYTFALEHIFKKINKYDLNLLIKNIDIKLILNDEYFINSMIKLNDTMIVKKLYYKWLQYIKHLKLYDNNHVKIVLIFQEFIKNIDTKSKTRIILILINKITNINNIWFENFTEQNRYFYINFYKLTIFSQELIHYQKELENLTKNMILFRFYDSFILKEDNKHGQ